VTYKYREISKNKLQSLCNEYESLTRTFREISASLQLHVLQQAAVIGRKKVLGVSEGYQE
jgi:hypothetical protein